MNTTSDYSEPRMPTYSYEKDACYTWTFSRDSSCVGSLPECWIVIGVLNLSSIISTTYIGGELPEPSSLTANFLTQKAFDYRPA